ncbi:hypothetical protein CVT25_001920 [Psilocybe cyanescens]|uniref:Uncharacterized protein n=1 Tax=Psilocybe cyanescens TaxID=93625 RepID=A0A409WQJ8_PSICY|nr:hypothetical protein CVT25_001920 [Psilocybe cyanescens]
MVAQIRDGVMSLDTMGSEVDRDSAVNQLHFPLLSHRSAPPPQYLPPSSSLPLPVDPSLHQAVPSSSPLIPGWPPSFSRALIVYQS